MAELTVVAGAEARNGRGHGGDSDFGQSASAAAPCVRLRLSVRVPQVTALKMELSRVTGSAGSPLVRGGARAKQRCCPAQRHLVRALTPRAPRVPPRQSPSVAEVVGGGCELEARAHRRSGASSNMLLPFFAWLSETGADGLRPCCRRCTR